MTRKTTAAMATWARDAGKPSEPTGVRLATQRGVRKNAAVVGAWAHGVGNLSNRPARVCRRGAPADWDAAKRRARKITAAGAARARDAGNHSGCGRVGTRRGKTSELTGAHLATQRGVRKNAAAVDAWVRDAGTLSNRPTRVWQRGAPADWDAAKRGARKITAAGAARARDAENHGGCGRVGARRGKPSEPTGARLATRRFCGLGSIEARGA